MKQNSALLLLLCLTLMAALLFALFPFTPAKAQVIVGNQTIMITFSAPSGSCSSTNPLQILVPNGTLYSCQSGIWATVGGGSGTVTNTGGALTSNAVVLGNGGSDTKVSTGITTNGASELDLGVNGTASGTLGLNGSTSGKATLTTNATALVTTFNGGAAASLVPSNNNSDLLGGSAAEWGAIYGVQFGTGDANDIQLFTANGGAAWKLLNTGKHFAFTSGKGQHFNNQAANSDTDSQCALSSGTCTFNFTTSYTSAPVCTATVTTTGTFTTGATLKIATATGSYTVTSTTGTDSATVNVHCAGNPT